MAPGSSLSSLRFRLLWAGQSVSVLGDGAAVLAVPLLVLRATDSVLATALVVASRTAAYLVVGLVAGALVDRWDVRRVLIVSDALRAVSFVLLPAVVLLPAGGWLVLGVAFGASSAGVFFETAIAIAVKDSLAPKDLVAGNARLELSNQLGLLVGPAAIGVALASLGVETCLYINAATFAVSALTIVPLRFGRTERNTAGGSKIWRDMMSGVRYIRSSQIIANIVSLQVVINFVVAVEVLIVVYATRGLQASPTWVGIILSAAGVGGLVAMTVARWAANRFASERLIAWSVIALGFSLLAMALARNAVQLCVVNAVHGALSVLATVNIRAVRQRVVPRELLGRVTASARSAAMAAHPFGAALFGVLAQAADGNARWAFLTAAVLSLLSAVVAYRGLLRTARTDAGTPEKAPEG
ncbi:MFS transporter [Longimycelium tulufanense]|uniref:MFS transporter n=1 Tax=Longimycelium tulufanense TaxID=907463 RepID=A0A8J3CAX3_9PSEU|nr:MFS transporter [Longimycelium tulufanense]GGM67222.1 MFS transporter [Longimycelium tulufanense]